MPISTDQLRRVTDFAVGLQGVRDYFEIAQLSVDVLADLIACDAPNVAYIPQAGEKGYQTALSPWDHASNSPYCPAYAHEDPVYQNRLRLLIDRPAHVNEFITFRELERTAIFNEVWKPARIRTHLTITDETKHGLAISLTRNGSSPFQADDGHLLGSVTRLIDGAIGSLIRANGGRIPIGGVLHAINHTTWLVCDTAGRILRSNAAALAHLDAAFPAAGGFRVGSHIPASYLRVYQSRFLGGPRQPQRHALPTGLLTAHVAPIRGCDTEFSVYFVFEPHLAPASPQGVPSRADLRTLGLTPKEAEVLEWIIQGKTNPEIAIILGSSPLTVKKHVEHVFQKLGVETRTAAVMRAFETLAAPPPR